MLNDLKKVLSGNLVAQVINFLILTLLTRILSTTEYGYYAVSIAYFTLILQIVSFGSEVGFIAYTSKSKASISSVYNEIIKVKAILALTFIIVCAPFYGDILNFIYGNDALGGDLVVIGCGLILYSQFNLLLAKRQAEEEFAKYSWYLFFNALAKLLVMLLLVSLSFISTIKFNFLDFVYIYIFSVFINLAYNFKIKDAIIFLSTFFSSFLRSIRAIKEVYIIGGWVFLSGIATVIMLRLDILMLNEMSSLSEVARYSVAMNLAMLFPTVSSAITATLLPKIESLLATKSLRSHALVVISYSKFLIPLLIVVCCFSSVVITILFGDKYKDSASVFNVLAIGLSFGILVNPVSVGFYSLGKAKLLTLMNWLQLPINFLGNFMLIPEYGSLGASISTLLVKFFAFIYIYTYIFKREL